MSNHTPHNKLHARWQSLKSERASWDSHWKDISDHLLPRAGRFLVGDRNRGDKRHNHIIDSTGTRALRILAAGMMSGMTSPARPWFKLGAVDQDLMKHAPVKIWLNEVTQLMLRIFQRSNTYRVLHTMYEELGAFGTAASLIVPNFDSVIRHQPLTVGEYCIATDWNGEVTTLYREFQKTVGEIVKEFGLDQVSTSVRNLYDRGHLDEWVTLIHAIEPRSDRDITRADSRNMPWRSVYFEADHPGGKYLRESGFRRFPAVAPRWAVAGGDIYGGGPAIDALGDIRQLQHQQRRKAEAIDYQTQPPLQIPTGMKNHTVDILPGGITYVDAINPSGGIKTAFEVQLNLNELLTDIQDVRQRVNSAFYADMFLMLAELNTPRMTAYEVAERHEEKLLMIGPVTERLKNELLDPMVEMTFDAIIEAGILPPPPEEMQGQNLNIEMIGILAQAQRAIGVNSIDRFISSVGNVAQAKPEVLDRINADRYVDIYADALGVDPELILPEDQVQAIRQQRAMQQQAAQQAAQLQQGADTAQKLASADTGSANLLTNLSQTLQE